MFNSLFFCLRPTGQWEFIALDHDVIQLAQEGVRFDFSEFLYAFTAEQLGKESMKTLESMPMEMFNLAKQLVSHPILNESYYGFSAITNSCNDNETVQWRHFDHYEDYEAWEKSLEKEVENWNLHTPGANSVRSLYSNGLIAESALKSEHIDHMPALMKVNAIGEARSLEMVKLFVKNEEEKTKRPEIFIAYGVAGKVEIENKKLMSKDECDLDIHGKIPMGFRTASELKDKAKERNHKIARLIRTLDHGDYLYTIK